MGDHHKSQSSNFHRILGIPKSASLAEICKAYKSLVMKWHPDRNPSNKSEVVAKFSSINEAYRALSLKKRIEEKADNENQEPKTAKKKKAPSDSESDEYVKRKELHISPPTLLSRTTSRTSPLRSPTIDFHTSFPITSSDGNTSIETGEPPLLSKMASQRCSTPIFFSQSIARRKPPPVEKKLKCTLEELCHGCVKKIKITRDAISSSGLIVQEDEIMMINVKPGWKKGTKITFEGKGDERPGTLPADIIFCIDEKRHKLFKRENDDLELGVEIQLVQALTGCTVPVPLLGGGQIKLSIDDIIYPGYEKIVPGQGMTISEEGKRGDLRLKFLVEFPAELTEAQRSEVVGILEGGCS